MNAPETAGSQPTATGVEARVCEDIARRQEMGVRKYGQTVADNPLGFRAWLQHSYEEKLDDVIYLKRAIEEMDALPEKLARDLFTNGHGETCDRLVQTVDTAPKTYGAGWSLSAITARIRKVLNCAGALF